MNSQTNPLTLDRRVGPEGIVQIVAMQSWRNIEKVIVSFVLVCTGKQVRIACDDNIGGNQDCAIEVGLVRNPCTLGRGIDRVCDVGNCIQGRSGKQFPDIVGEIDVAQDPRVSEAKTLSSTVSALLVF